MYFIYIPISFSGILLLSHHAPYRHAAKKRNDIFLYNHCILKHGVMAMEIPKTKQGIHKSRGGLIRSFVTLERGSIMEITISGDFFLFPEEAIFAILENLRGTPAKREDIQKNIEG